MRLVFNEADQRREFTLPGHKIVVGRQKQCGLSVRDLSISKEHCEIEAIGSNALRIRDLGSRNGTWVNGEKIGDQFVNVTDKDDLIIGKLPVQLFDTAQQAVPSMDEEGTMFDPDFVSVAPRATSAPAQAHYQPPVAVSAPAAHSASAPDMSEKALAGEVCEPGLPATKFTLNPGNHTIGTDVGCSVQLSSSGVSGCHAKLEYVGGQWFVEDLGSRNGSYINKQVVTRNPIGPGDVLFFGPVKVEIAKRSGPVVPQSVASGISLTVSNPGEKKARSKILPLAVVGLLLVVAGIGFAVTRKSDPQQNDNPNAGAAQELAQLKAALSEGIKSLRKKDYDSAINLFAAANRVKKLGATDNLIKLSNYLKSNPTDNITQIVSVSNELQILTNPLWKDTDVVRFSQEVNSLWAAESVNAELAASGDQLFREQKWEDALERYDKIGRNSEFRTARIANLDTCRRNIAEMMIKQAESEIGLAKPEDAVITLNKAQVYATPAQQARIYNLITEAQQNRKFGKLLREGKDLLQAGDLEGAHSKLQEIPQESQRYFAEASTLIEEISNRLKRARAIKAYNDGNGEAALVELQGTVTQDLRDLRTKIEKVTEIYREAKRQFDAKEYSGANKLWEALRALVDDPDNFYFKEAVKNVAVDPVTESKRYSDRARRLVNNIDPEKIILAALNISQALHEHAENADAIALQQDMERKLNLEWLLVQQKWRDKAMEDAEFIEKAVYLYRLQLAVRPSGSARLTQIGKAILQAGAELPPADKLPPEEE